MSYYDPPMLIDVFRLTRPTLDATVHEVIAYLKRNGGGFNYNRAAAHIRAAYDGYWNIESLVRQCRGFGNSVSLVHNAKVVELAAPLAKDRKTQTFDFPRRELVLKHGISSPLGPRFFFTEDGVIKVFYLHSRKDFRANLVDLAAVAVTYRTHILENDFFGQPGDIEIVDVDRSKERANRYSLADLMPMLGEDPNVLLDRFVEAFIAIDESKAAGEKKERRPPTAHDDDQQTFGW